MAGRTPSAAVAEFIAPLQRALSCVTNQVIVRSPDSTKPGGIRALLLPKIGFADLKGSQRLQLSFAMEYEIVQTSDPDRGPWKISTRQYRYHVVTEAMDEVVLYHWLPLGRCSTTEPHAHIGQSQLTREAIITRKAHIPSGRLELETVVESLITELGVVPLRSDWRDLLVEGRERFVRWQTWS